MAINVLFDGVGTTHELTGLHLEIYVLKQPLADINEYTAGKLKKLSVDNQVSQNYLLQLIQRNKKKNASNQDSLCNEYTDISQPFSMGKCPYISLYWTQGKPLGVGMDSTKKKKKSYNLYP